MRWWELIAIVDSAATTAAAVQRMLTSASLNRASGSGTHLALLATDGPARFCAGGRDFSGRANRSAEYRDGGPLVESGIEYGSGSDLAPADAEGSLIPSPSGAATGTTAGHPACPRHCARSPPPVLSDPALTVTGFTASRIDTGWQSEGQHAAFDPTEMRACA